MSKQSTPKRAPLVDQERAALRRLMANLGPNIAARTLGIKPSTLHSAALGNDVNPSTARQLHESYWFRTALKEVTS
jgi:hypothetical protein